MKKFMFLAMCFVPIAFAANAVSFQPATAGATNVARTGATTRTANQQRGFPQLAETRRQQQRNTHYIINTPDVDTACRERIFQCLVDYCGDVTVIPGQREGRCVGATEGELYNWVLLCLQRDTTPLMPNFQAGFTTGGNAMNIAARLCPSFVQQELMAYLAMANMAEQLNKQRSDQCVQRRRELEAAISCHQVALTSGGETHNRLVSTLADFCGAGIPGGSQEMVMQFANAGNIGGNIFGWAENLLTLDGSRRGPEWQTAVDAVLAGHVNRMNLACGENMQMQFQPREITVGPTALQTVAAAAVGTAIGTTFQSPQTAQTPPTAPGAAMPPVVSANLWEEFRSLTDIFDIGTASQVVMAGLEQPPTMQNPFLTSATMASMQNARRAGTKVFVLRDSIRCFIVVVESLNPAENNAIAHQLANCRYN
ncbi:MAG: hypothetical protein FWE64_02390 [Alphaproteobacteria bacterium]|nr:hypothetical protein [Alphaproteobacteria bacterium]